ncbi:MAG TPA: biotin-dependent carboxyltransferase family protein [Nitrospira sp.]|nr:biotin-dependent carboxyltransferase family protein [Nitrospira sp.]
MPASKCWHRVMPTTEPTCIRVMKPGWCTTVQDFGRHGYQHYGVSPSGAMDRLALVIANRLVNNPDTAAVLEITLLGPDLLFEHAALLAITGADLSPAIDGECVPLWTTLAIQAGSRLTFGPRRTGARSYLAAAGGIDVPLLWGSRSTHLSSGMGGLNGRALLADDILRLNVIGGGRKGPRIGRTLAPQSRPIYVESPALRIVIGPQDVGAAALTSLTRRPYQVGSQSDRMGYRLEGQRVQNVSAEATISAISANSAISAMSAISDGTAMGALQIPPDGRPILLMADRPTTGGYPKAAVVIAADLPQAGQLQPGDTLTFRRTTLPEAEAAFAQQWGELGQALPPAEP